MVITGLTRNQLTGNRPWVRIPPAPPYRDVAQLGRALRSGRRGRRFKSCHPDQKSTRLVRDLSILLIHYYLFTIDLSIFGK